MNETIQTILNRRSIRVFQNKQLSDEDLKLIIEAGKFAPSAMNEQPWHFSVVQNRELLSEINEQCKTVFLKSGNPFFIERAQDKNFSVFYNAPTFIIISGDQKAIAPQHDCSLAMENMFLAAYSLGIGSCWIHAIRMLFSPDQKSELADKLQIPSGFAVVASAAFGYKTDMVPPSAPRKEGTVSIIK